MGERKSENLCKFSTLSRRHKSLADMAAHTLIHAIVSRSAERPVLSTKDKKRLELVELDRVKLSVVGAELRKYPGRRESSS